MNTVTKAIAIALTAAALPAFAAKTATSTIAITTFTAGQPAYASEVNTNFANLATATESNQTQLASTISTANTNKGSIGTIQDTVKQNTTNIGTIKGSAGKNTTEVSELKGTTGKNSSDILGLQGSVSKNTTDISTVKGTATTNGQNITTVTSTANQNKSDIAALQAAVGVAPKNVCFASSAADINTCIGKDQNLTSKDPASILLAPNTYTLTSSITVPAYVSLSSQYQGKDVTINTGNNTITLTGNSKLSGISIANTTGGTKPLLNLNGSDISIKNTAINADGSNLIMTTALIDIAGNSSNLNINNSTITLTNPETLSIFNNTGSGNLSIFNSTINTAGANLISSDQTGMRINLVNTGVMQIKNDTANSNGNIGCANAYTDETNVGYASLSNSCTAS